MDCLGGDEIIRSYVDGVFLSYYLNGQKTRYCSNGSGCCSNSLIAKLQIFNARFCEQQKIADCLSSLDELITAQTQKIDALKAHKNGLMQKLFPSMDRWIYESF